MEMLDTLRNYIPKLYFHKVFWTPPVEGYIIYNTNVGNKENPGPIAFGFCIRNSEGNLLYGKSQHIGIGSNIDTKIVAIFSALIFYFGRSYHKICLQTDSLILKNMITGE